MRMPARLIGFALLVLLAGIAATESAAQPFEFFAFDNGVGRGQLKPEQQAEILAELGFAGIGYTGTQDIPAMLAALDQRGLKFFSTYVAVNLKPDAAPYDAGLPAAIEQLKGRGAVLWVHVLGAPASTTDMDDRAVDILRELATLAQKSGLRIALYPHTGFYVATVQDAVRLAKKVERPNVGASFNLCHFLKLDDEQNIRRVVEGAMPHLFLVSVSGADQGNTKSMGWDRLIQPLGQGDFDVKGVLKILKEIGYKGPVGLQCYGIRGGPLDHLPKSMEAWHKLNEDL